MQRYLFIALTFAYVLGIVIAHYFWVNSAFVVYLTTSVIALTLLFRRNFILIIVLWCVILGVLNTSARFYLTERAENELLHRPGPLRGTVEKFSQKDRTELIDLKVEHSMLTARLIVYTKSSVPLKVGQTLTVNPPFEWKPPEAGAGSPLAIAVNSTQIIPGKIHITLSSILHCLNTACFSVHQRSLPPPFDALMTSLVFGDDIVKLPQEMSSAYQRTGVIHLLVVSGAQVALLLSIFIRLCGLLRLSRPLTFAFSTLFNIFFVLLTGAGPSIARAGFMAEFALLARASGRAQHFYTTLALSALALLIFDPLCLFGIGFQLSFTSTFALFYVAPLLEDRMQTMFGRFTGPLSIALAPLLLSTPLIMFHFNRISLIALPANLFVALIIEVLVVTGFGATLLGLIHLFPLAFILDQGNLVLMTIMNTVVTKLSELSFAQLNVRTPSTIVLIVFYAMLFLMFEHLRRYRTWPKKSLLIVLALSTVLLILPAPQQLFAKDAGTLTITAIDVGQGDSFLIETPQHKKVLIDGGPAFTGDRSALSYLAKHGINDLDGIILTHEHADHINGLLPVVENINVNWIGISGFQGNSPAFKKFMQMINKKKIPVHILGRGSVIKPSPACELDVLYPDPPFANRPENTNDTSVICRLIYGSFSMLFTGDASTRVEQGLCAEQVTLNAIILKAGHHGSRTSSSAVFLTKVHPSAVVISCGKDNKFGHPHKEFLERLNALQLNTRTKLGIYRTDERGTIIITTDGTTYSIRS